MKKTILILAANPEDTQRLRLDMEVREIDEGLRRSRRRDIFDLQQRWAVRAKDLRRAMLDLQPAYVHFAGHGDEASGICLEDDGGNTHLVPPAALGVFFGLFHDVVDCVLLNACYTEWQADAISKHVSYVIGIADKVSDKNSIEFAVAFYDAIGAGKSIPFAYELACAALQLSGMQDKLRPVLKTRSNSNYIPPDPIQWSPSLDALSTIELPDTEIYNLDHDARIDAANYESNRESQIEDSVQDLDIYRLDKALESGQWQRADIETYRLLLRASERQEDEKLRPQDVERLPCALLQIVDRLWSHYSNGRYGFRSQTQVWRNGIGNQNKVTVTSFGMFSDVVGWRRNGLWQIDYGSFLFLADAPKGHLPTLRQPIPRHSVNTLWLESWMALFAKLLSRSEECLN